MAINQCRTYLSHDNFTTHPHGEEPRLTWTLMSQPCRSRTWTHRTCCLLTAICSALHWLLFTAFTWAPYCSSSSITSAWSLQHTSPSSSLSSSSGLYDDRHCVSYENASCKLILWVTISDTIHTIAVQSAFLSAVTLSWALPTPKRTFQNYWSRFLYVDGLPVAKEAKPPPDWCSPQAVQNTSQRSSVTSTGCVLQSAYASVSVFWRTVVWMAPPHR